MSTKIEKRTLMVQNQPISLLSYKVEKPKAIVQIFHGMCEHKERYIYLCEKLAEAGYSSYIHDHRGHGESVKSEDDLGYIGTDDHTTLIEDAHNILEIIKAENPSKKVFLFTHSMGSLVGRNFIKKYDGEIDALVLCGHPFARAGLGAAGALVKTMEKTLGAHSRNKLLDDMALGEYQKSFADEGINAWTSSDPEEVKLYDEDPLCGFSFTINAYGHLLYLQREAYTKKNWAMNKPELPILLIAGEDDPCAGDLEHFKKSQKSLKEQGYSNVKWKRYPGKRHELLHEQIKDEVIADVLRFYEKSL